MKFVIVLLFVAVVYASAEPMAEPEADPEPYAFPDPDPEADPEADADALDDDVMADDPRYQYDEGVAVDYVVAGPDAAKN